MNERSNISRGLMGGVIAAAVFATWFLLIDFAGGQPFRTPAYMSGLVFSFTTALPATARLIAFTLLHFLAFAIVGVVVSLLLAKWNVRPRIYLGIALGFLLFDLLFYGSVMIVGVDVVRELGWPQVLTGNLIACAVMLAYMRARSGLPVFTIGETLRRRATLRRGLVAGALGAAAVAFWFFIVDGASGRLLYTPAALGSALFLGVSSADDVVVSAPIVFGYTLVHLAAFFLVGLFAAWLTEEADRHPPVLLGMVLFFAVLEVFSLGMLAAVAAWLFDTVPWWSPIVANLLAASVMIGYLWREHPALREHFGSSVEDEPAVSGGPAHGFHAAPRS